jgi:UDP-N-acetylmuramoyl-L-alanyl-D-glutamate--2,6-diaminopimelate ligase
LGELICDLDAELEGNREMEISGVAYDSRKVQPGDLFVAIDGFSASGRNFVRDALERGALAVAGAGELGIDRARAAQVRTANPRRFLALAANRFYDAPSKAVKVVGVTGTNGKTTFTYLVKAILEAAGERCGLVGTIQHFDGENWFMAANTTPESPDLVRLLDHLRTVGVRYCAMEVSSHAIALERIAGLDFAVGVFTNLSQDHLDFHQTMEEYKRVKLEFFRSLSPAAWVVYNADDPVGAEVRTATKARTMSFGFSDGCDVRAEVLRVNEQGTEFTLRLLEAETTISTGLIGRHNVADIMASAGACLCLGIALPAIRQGVAQLRAVPGRMERVVACRSQDFSVFVDYAHSPDALGNSLRAVRALTQKRVIVVFGCGGNRDKGKRPLMGRIARELADVVVITSDNPRDEEPQAIIDEILQGTVDSPSRSAVPGEPIVVPDRRQAIARALELARDGDIVLIAGKGHEDYQIVGKERLHFDDREVAREMLCAPAGVN